MFMPRPVPSIDRFRFSSILWKAVKSLEMSSVFMPIPVSTTRALSMMKRSLPVLSPPRAAKPSPCRSVSAGSSQPISSVTLPSRVYLTALVRMFRMHCLMRISSP